MELMKMKKDNFEIGDECWVQKRPATIVGYIEYGSKLAYIWVKFIEAEERIKPQKVRLA